MKSKILILVALLVTSISFSQRNPESTYMSTFEYKAKSGMVDKFEKAVAKKTKMFNTEEGSIIFTYRVLTGNNTGNYERYLVGQSSDSYDMDRSEELEYWEKNVAPYGDPVGGQVRWLQEQWASISDTSAPKYLQKLVLRYKPGMEAHVSRFIYRWGKTWEKRNPNAWRRAFSVVSGGDLNLFVVFNGFDKFGSWTENPDSTWEEDYNEMFGWEQYATDRMNFEKSLRDWNGAVRTTSERIDF